MIKQQPSTHLQAQSVSQSVRRSIRALNDVMLVIRGDHMRPDLERDTLWSEYASN